MSRTKSSKLRARLMFLYIGSFVACIFPLIACFAANWSKYTEAPGESIRLCIGGSIAAFLLLLKVVGRLRMPRRVVAYGVVFVLAYLLQAILDDLVLLSGMALVGELLDLVCFQRAIRRTKEKLIIGKTAEVTATQVEEVIKKYIGRV